MKYNAIYANLEVKEVELGDLIHKGGASGKIYMLKSSADKVIKLFHSTSNSATNRAKLELMLLNPPAIEKIEKDGEFFCQIAWPEALLEDDNGFCVGYVMPLIDMKKAVSLDYLMQKAVRKKLGLSEKYAYRLFAAYNVASVVNALHQKGHYIVDLKPSNIYVYKDNMFAALVDCDGFSIKGENNNRYPAEFVSEEYILPEGINMACDEMGESQDRFALSVLIFKLLNNGIHPFAGTPKKQNGKILSIQERVFAYHYPYAMWPDAYQDPHPYSMHQYFDTKTLEMFDNSFSKKSERPSALEWQDHLWHLLSQLKMCKKNPDHVFWTNKGCGLCAIDNKFFHNMSEITATKEKQKLIRGMQAKDLTTEQVEINKQIQNAATQKKTYIAYGIYGLYALFFGAFYKIVEPFKNDLQSMGVGVQAIGISFILLLINSLIKKYNKKLMFLDDNQTQNLVQIYAFVCLIISFIVINDIDLSAFRLVDVNLAS